MINETFELIEYRGFKNIFIGLYKGKEQYYIIYGATGKPSICLQEDTIDAYGHSGGWINTKLFTFSANKELSVIIPFINKNDALTHVIAINKPEEYNQIVTILEDIL